MDCVKGSHCILLDSYIYILKFFQLLVVVCGVKVVKNMHTHTR